MFSPLSHFSARSSRRPGECLDWLFQGSEQRSYVLRVRTKSDFTSHLCSWVPLCPFCLPFLFTSTPPFFFFLMLILLALSEPLLYPRHPAGPGVCVDNSQSCQFVLPDVGGTQRQDEVSSAFREVRAVGSQGGSSLAGANLEEGRPDSRSVR